MTWDVVVLGGANDRYAPAGLAPQHTLHVPLCIPGHRDSVSSFAADEFARFGLTPSDTAWDFLHACIAAYTADMRIARHDAFDNWTRDIRLHLAVHDLALWNNAAPIFQKLLAFLTGDHWEISLHHVGARFAPGQSTVAREVVVATNQVCLFSGGLDSYIGAIEILERGVNQVLLIGHHGGGGGPTSTSQKRSVTALHAAYTADRAPFMHVWVSPPKGQYRASEITTRGRSIMFFGLGVSVAACLNDGLLTVPENGLISLNVPLTASRTGSFSTRTTHPYLVSLIRQLLAQLNLGVDVALPYRFATKGEMAALVQPRVAFQNGVVSTMSCARPGVARFSGVKNPNLHCGYCLPCLIRRAALYKIQQDPTPYLVNNLRVPLSQVRRADLRALKMAVDRYSTSPPTVGDILKSGPIPSTEGSVVDYLAMFKRGIDELSIFLQNNT